MPLPLGDCADDIPWAVCCDSVFCIADRLRAVAFDALAGCIGDACRGVRSYVTVGSRPPEPIGDALVVSFIESLPSQGTRSRTGQTTLGASIQQARFEIWLTENGWPTPVVDELGNVISVPDAELIEALARHAYSHAEVMYRGILNAYSTGTLFPPQTFANVHKTEISGLYPVNPAAFTIGWRIPVIVQYFFNPMISVGS